MLNYFFSCIQYFFLSLNMILFEHFQNFPIAQMDNFVVKMVDALQCIGAVICKMIVMMDQMKLTVQIFPAILQLLVHVSYIIIIYS